MPKKRPLPAAQHDRDFVAEITCACIKNGLSENDLAVFLHMSYSTLNDRLKKPETFTLKELRALKKRLKLDVII